MGNTSELDGNFERLFDEHQDFDDAVLSLCDDATLLRLAANRNSARRQLFASGLIERLSSTLYAHHGLPYEFSRFSGLMSFDDFKNQEMNRLKRVYDACKTVETMRTSPQEEIKNIGDIILDFRHDCRRPHTNTTKPPIAKLPDKDQFASRCYLVYNTHLLIPQRWLQIEDWIRGPG